MDEIWGKALHITTDKIITLWGNVQKATLVDGEFIIWVPSAGEKNFGTLLIGQGTQ